MQIRLCFNLPLEGEEGAEGSSGTSGGRQYGEAPVRILQTALVSQASRREFALHSTLVILKNANLKTEIILVVVVQYVTTFVVLLLGGQKPVFGVG